MQSLLAKVVLNPFAACLGTGFLLGQIVLAMAVRHEHRPIGLAYALVFVLAGSASLTLFLKHWHAQRRPARPGAKAPLEAWLVLLGLALMVSLRLPLLG